MEKKIVTYISKHLKTNEKALWLLDNFSTVMEQQ
jgi:hypothetical protein